MSVDYDVSQSFKRIENELIDSMMRNFKRHRVDEAKEGFTWEQWQVLQLKELEKYRLANPKRFQGDFSSINKRVEDALKTTYTDAKSAEEAKILEQIKKGKIRQTRGSGAVAGKFFGVNAGRIEHLIEATKADFGRGEWAILRQANDQYRKIIFNAQMYSATGATYEQAVDMATKDFLKAGIQSITYKNGARHTMADYSRMALKTGQKRAYLMGEGDVHDKYGIHTVRVNKRVDACPLCVKWLGKVLVDDVYAGGTAEEAQKAGVPLLSEAIDEGFLHPNCKDVYSMYIEGVSKPADPWSKKELEEIADKYNAEQALQRAEDMQASYQRMADNSLDKMNVQRYQARADAWGARAEQIRAGAPPTPITPATPPQEPPQTETLETWNKENIRKAKEFDVWLDSDITDSFEVDGNIFEKLPLKEVQEYLKSRNGYYTYGEIPQNETWAVMYKDGTSVVLGEGDSLKGVKRNNILYAVYENENTTMIFGKSKDIGIFNQAEFGEGLDLWRVGAKSKDDKLLQFVGDYFETAEAVAPITEEVARQNVKDAKHALRPKRIQLEKKEAELKALKEAEKKWASLARWGDNTKENIKSMAQNRRSFRGLYDDEKAIFLLEKHFDAFQRGEVDDVLKKPLQAEIKPLKKEVKELAKELDLRYDELEKIIGEPNLTELAPYGENHTVPLKHMLDDAPDMARGAWEKVASSLRVITSSYTRAGRRRKGNYYSPSERGVWSPIKKASQGNSYELPYEVTFHEFGHNMDFVLNDMIGTGTDRLPFSFTYKNGAFGKTIMQEVEDAIIKFGEDHGLVGLPNRGTVIQEANRKVRFGTLKPEDKASWIQKELKTERVDRIRAEKEMNKYMKANYSKSERASLSDMFEHAMVDKDDHHPFGFGHGMKYWSDDPKIGVSGQVGVEAFAEMYASTLANEDSLELIKEYLPKSYKIFKEMLEVASGQIR